MVALLAFASLAVDVGHVYVVKAELQLAADAAARYGAAGLSTSVTAARANAIDAANDNTADGTPVDLATDDIEFGMWNASSRSFTALTGSAASGANAVRVTARRTAAAGNAVQLMFARVLGRTSFDVTATSIARKATPGSGGFTGLSSFSAGNNAVIAGYDSSAGAPGGTNVLDLGDIGSNGSIQVGNNSDIHGSVTMGPSGNFQKGNNTTVTGSESELGSPMSYPPTESPTVASSGTLTVGNGQTVTLGGGTHTYTTVRVEQGGTLTFSGSATVYVTGTLVLDNDARLLASDSLPENLHVRLTGAVACDCGNGVTIIADVYGPQATFDAGNNFRLRGSLVADVLSVGNNAELYYDRQLSSGGGGSAIVTVD